MGAPGTRSGASSEQNASHFGKAGRRSTSPRAELHTWEFRDGRSGILMDLPLVTISAGMRTGRAQVSSEAQDARARASRVPRRPPMQTAGEILMDQPLMMILFERGAAFLQMVKVVFPLTSFVQHSFSSHPLFRGRSILGQISFMRTPMMGKSIEGLGLWGKQRNMIAVFLTSCMRLQMWTQRRQSLSVRKTSVCLRAKSQEHLRARAVRSPSARGI